MTKLIAVENYVTDEHQLPALRKPLEPEPRLKPMSKYESDHIAKEVHRRLSNIKRNLYEIGELLWRAQQGMAWQKDGFLNWFEENFSQEFSRSKAYKIVAVYRWCRGKPELLQYIPSFTILTLIASKTFPKDIGDRIWENAENWDTAIKVKDFREFYEEAKRGALEPDSPETQRLFVEDKERQDIRKHVSAVDAELARVVSVYGELVRVGKLSKLDGETWLTKEQEDGEGVKILKQLGMMLKYRVFREVDGRISKD